MRIGIQAAWLFLGLIGAAIQAPSTPPEQFRPSYSGGDWSSATIRQDVAYRRESSAAPTAASPASDVQESQSVGFEVAFRTLSRQPDGSRAVEVEYRRFPNMPISIGSTWEAPAFVAPPNSQTRPWVYKYKVLDRVTKDGEDCLRIAATYSSSGSADRPGADGVAIHSESMSDGIVVFYFSLKRGMMVARSLSWQGHSTAKRGDQRISSGKTLGMYETSVTFR